MELQQTTELSYAKINEIDSKVNDLLDAVGNTSSGSSGEDSETIQNIKTNVENIIESTNNINSNISNQANNITTINSNTATILNNINTIKNNVDNIKDTSPKKSFSNVAIQQLSEILKTVKEIKGEETFEEDPFKISGMAYSGRIEGNRNESNYDLFEIAHDFTTKQSLVGVIADITGSTFDFNLEVTFTASGSGTVHEYGNFNSYVYGHSYQAGTQTLKINKQNLNVKDGRIIFNYTCNSEIVVHHLKLELWGENVYIVHNRYPKYKVNHTRNKVIITKVEDYNGYYLEIDNNYALTPDKIKQEFVKEIEGVRDYDLTYDLVKNKNKYFSLCPVSSYVFLNNTFGTNIFNGYLTLTNVYRCFNCKCGDSTTSYYYTAVSGFYYDYSPSAMQYRISSSISRSYMSNLSNRTANMNFVRNLYEHENAVTTDFIVETIEGTIYYVINNSTYFELTHGINPTAFIDKDDPNKVNIYYNDGGYCIKTIVQISEDRKSLNILSQTIIGTYDVYHECLNDVYIVEKDRQLYMFKKSLETEDDDYIDGMPDPETPTPEF